VENYLSSLGKHICIPNYDHLTSFEDGEKIFTSNLMLLWN